MSTRAIVVQGTEGHFGASSLELARRSIQSVLRLPSVFIPTVVFPVFLIIAFSGAFSALVNIPGFPTDTILNWYIPLAICQGAAFVGVGVGLATTRDIETGFYDRLLLSPVPRTALLLGPSLGAVVRVIGPFIVVLAIGLAGGAKFEDGVLGLWTLAAAPARGTCLFQAFWTLGLAYRLRSQRAAPLMQIGVFFTIFLATAQVPLAAMTGWLKSVATVNPMTNVLRLGRANFVGGNGVTWEECWGGLLALAVFMILAAVWAFRGMRRLVP